MVSTDATVGVASLLPGADESPDSSQLPLTPAQQEEQKCCITTRWKLNSKIPNCFHLFDWGGVEALLTSQLLTWPSLNIPDRGIRASGTAWQIWKFRCLTCPLLVGVEMK